jgi:hypothetical protein
MIGVCAIGSPELKLEMATATGLNCRRDRPEKNKTLGKLAEGEELGSNLLRVDQSILENAGSF